MLGWGGAEIKNIPVSLLIVNDLFHSRCECPDGRFGVTCSEESSACTTGRHACAEGSKCSVVKDGAYECLCPLGKSGEHCNEGLFRLMIISGSILTTKVYSSLESKCQSS